MLKPLKWNLDNASVPPAMTRSAKPALIMLAPNIMALAADEQAVDVVVTIRNGPHIDAIRSVALPQSLYCMC